MSDEINETFMQETSLVSHFDQPPSLHGDSQSEGGGSRTSQDMILDEEFEKEAVAPVRPIQDSQTDLRRRIMAIQSNPSLSAAEKARQVQTLMTSNWTAKQKSTMQTVSAANKLSEKSIDFSHLTAQDLEPTWHNKEMQILGCKHYQRSSKLQGHCCGRWFPCRFCHDEVSDHNIVRNLTTTMMCMYCKTVQPAGRVCTNTSCLKVISKYYCAECKLWDDDKRKNIYHCHDCGICRIGKGLEQDYFHCKKCNVCMAISLKGNHKCIDRNLESDCPICGEYMFTSTTTVIFMPCGHCIHFKCHQEYIQTSYQCPTCSKSLGNMTEYFKRIDAMLALHTMPPEYRNTQSNIYCNDCEKKSVAKYHFLYHKCTFCNGYNSKVISTFEGVVSLDKSTSANPDTGLCAAAAVEEPSAAIDTATSPSSASSSSS